MTLNSSSRRMLAITALCLSTAAALFAGKPLSEVPLLLDFEVGALSSDAGTYIDGTQNVLAILQPSGNFRFSTQDSTRQAPQRSMCYDFGTQLDGTGLPLAAQDCVNVTQPMHAYTTGDVPIQSLTYGQSVRKLTRFDWDDGGYRYRLGYGTDMDRDGVEDSPAVTVTCTADDASGACTTWRLAPETDGSAALFRFALTTKKGSTTEGPAEFVGRFTMPFVQTFTRK